MTQISRNNVYQVDSINTGTHKRGGGQWALENN